MVALLGGGSAFMEQQDLVTIQYPNAHNAWINQALTYGLPALGCYLMGFWVALRSLGGSLR